MFGNLMLFVSVLLVMGLLALLVGSLAWLYNDAEAHHKTGCLWVLIAFFTWPFGVIAYLLLRDREVRL